MPRRNEALNSAVAAVDAFEQEVLRKMGIDDPHFFEYREVKEMLDVARDLAEDTLYDLYSRIISANRSLNR